VADVDGQLVPGDQILVVNGIDVRRSQQQETAALLKVHDDTSPRVTYLLLCTWGEVTSQ